MITLDDLEAMFKTRISQGVLERDINGTKLKYLNPLDLIRLREQIALLIAAESDGGIALPGQALINFGGK